MMLFHFHGFLNRLFVVGSGIGDFFAFFEFLQGGFFYRHFGNTFFIRLYRIFLSVKLKGHFFAFDRFAVYFQRGLQNKFFRSFSLPLFSAKVLPSV